MTRDVGDSCLTSQRRSWAFFHVGKPYNLAFSRIIFENTANFTSRIVLPWNNNGKAVTTVYPTGSVFFVLIMLIALQHSIRC